MGNMQVQHSIRVLASLLVCPRMTLKNSFEGTGAKDKVENVVRPEDQAEAWRAHVSKAHLAMRLMFWRKADGAIEFANVGAKSELEIL